MTLIQAGGIGEIVTALQTGAIDAGVVFEDSIPMLKKMGFNELINLFDVPSMQATLSASGTFLNKYPVKVDNCLKAYLEAIKFYRENKEEALRISAAFMELKPENIPYLEGAYDMIVASDKIIPRIPYPTTKSIQTILAQVSSELRLNHCYA